MPIDIYHDYSVQAIEENLMFNIGMYTDDELHSALIVLCHIIRDQGRRIAELEKNAAVRNHVLPGHSVIVG